MTRQDLSAQRQAGAALTADQQTRGMRLAYVCQMLGVHLELFLSASALCPLFIKKLGGSDLQAMLPASMAGLMILIQIPISVLVAPALGKRFLSGCWVLASLPVVVIIVASLWFGAQALTVWIVLACIFVALLLLYGGSTFWYPLLDDVVPPRQLGRFFGTLRALWSLAYFAISVLAGIYVGRDPALWQFLVVLGAIAALQLLRKPCVARIPARLTHAIAAADWRKDIRAMIGRKDILMFCGYMMLLMFLAGFLAQPLVLYMKHLDFSTRDNTFIYAASVLGSVFALVLAGILVDRIGIRRVFLGVHLVLGALAFLIVVVGELPTGYAKPMLTVLQIIAGAAMAVAVLANTAQIFHLAPANAKTVYMSIMVSVSTIGKAFSPFLAGVILDSRWRQASVAIGLWTLDIFQLIFLGVGVGLILAMAILPFIQNTRPGGRARGIV